MPMARTPSMCTNNGTEISAYRGHAHVTAQGVGLTLDAAQRTQIMLDQAPQPAMGLSRNLFVNGELNEPWRQAGASIPIRAPMAVRWMGQPALVVDEGRRAVRYLRVGGQGNHCETVSGADPGSAASRSPLTRWWCAPPSRCATKASPGAAISVPSIRLMIRLTYRDVYDSEAEWVQGFYYENLSGNPATYGLQIPQDGWYFYESGNLLDSLPIRPYKLVRLRVYASGWDYDSLLSDINLVVE